MKAGRVLEFALSKREFRRVAEELTDYSYGTQMQARRYVWLPAVKLKSGAF
jgi:hypothetical protein